MKPIFLVCLLALLLIPLQNASSFQNIAEVKKLVFELRDKIIAAQNRQDYQTSARLYWDLAKAYTNLETPGLAERSYRRSIRDAQRAEVPLLVAQAYEAFGDYWEADNFITQKLENYQEANNLFAAAGNSTDQGRLMHKMGLFAHQAEIHDQVVASISPLAENPGSFAVGDRELATYYKVLIEAHHARGQQELALKYDDALDQLAMRLENSTSAATSSQIPPEFAFDGQLVANRYERVAREIKRSIKETLVEETLLRREQEALAKEKIAEAEAARARAEAEEARRIAEEAENQKLIYGVFGLSLAMLITGWALVARFQVNRKLAAQKKVIEVEKEKSEKLLLNILPLETAAELKETGKATPQHYDQVSVLFTDFKGFTKVAETLSPQELIEEINLYFQKFDEIVQQHGLEKIKTIGDAYMCAGGLPVANQSHAFDAVKAGLAMQKFVADIKEKHLRQGKPFFELRLGIHSGPVVAGVVGNKKFAYDIWGDTVNLAARMESSGEVGMVNISGDTYQLVKEHFNCQHRGKVMAKNKGEVEMYFVN